VFLYNLVDMARFLLSLFALIQPRNSNSIPGRVCRGLAAADRGTLEQSSAGVWSSHLDGAVSERIVPSDHSSPKNPEAIAEVHRILKLNAQSR
jgi:hypothetical protein